MTEKTKASIEEYKKLRQAVITQAVTKGVRGDRPMKDSGIEWIGEIPAEWETSTLGKISSSLRNGYVGPTKEILCDAGVPYIQSLHIKNGYVYFERNEYYVSQEWAVKHPKIHTNDLLFVQTGAEIGQVGLVPNEFDNCNCHALIIAELNINIIYPQFVTYYFLSHIGKEMLLYYKTGALLPHLNSGKIKFASVTCPPIAEQKEIAAYLDKKCAEIDALITKKETFLTELEAYKKSLIYEYVTGKKEVPQP